MVLHLAILLFSLFQIHQARPTEAGHSAIKPLRVGIVGLVHDHVHWILGRKDRGDIEIVGIAEPNRQLAESYAKQYGFGMEKVYSSMEDMVTATKPDAVLAFNSIYDHLKVVEYCAPRGIHVMVEKPLAVNKEHVARMITLAKQHNIYLLTNFETTWYGSNEKAWQIIKEQKAIGDIRKIDFYTGHQGPVEIGCSKAFLNWLTDPVQNGGGALVDFGCYGADLATWFMNGQTPETVSAVTQTIKPETYPKVDDEATIVLTYKKTQVVIQASWNWPYSRKEMEVYGKTGYVFCRDGKKMEVRRTGDREAGMIEAPGLPGERNDPFAYLAGVVDGSIRMNTYDLSAPATNEIVVKILDAARYSARTGQTVQWSAYFKEKN